MAILAGHFLLTADLLNRIAAPLLRERYSFIKGLSFRIRDDFIVAEMAGRYKITGFKGTAAVHLLELIFRPSLYRIDLQLSVKIQPGFLKPLFTGLLKRELSRQPGVSWRGEGLRLELTEMPFFMQLTRSERWKSLFSLLEVTRGEGSGGLLFQIYLHEPRPNGSGSS